MPVGMRTSTPGRRTDHPRATIRRVKNACHIAETADFDFDPDRDWEEAYLDNKKLGDWGTKCGFDVKPDPDFEKTWYDCYLKDLRK